MRQFEEVKLIFKNFLRRGTEVATLFPTSVRSAEELIRYVSSDKLQVIVELGAGTGAVTRVIEKKMHPQSKLFAFELNPHFIDYLKQHTKKAIVIEDDAALLKERLKEQGVHEVDIFISGLPLPSMSHENIHKIIMSCQEMAIKPMRWSQLTVLPYLYKKFYQSLFEHVEFKLLCSYPNGVYHMQGAYKRIRENGRRAVF